MRIVVQRKNSMKCFIFKIGLLVLLFFSAAQAVLAEKIILHPDHPQQYEVKEGDTLWGLASKFLQHPWQWPQLWRSNSNIANPRLIYPGDILQIQFHQGHPQLHRIGRGTLKLSPKIKIEYLDRPIPPVPFYQIEPLLNSTLVLNHNDLICAPYIIAFAGNHILGGPGVKAYVRGTVTQQQANYGIYRRGEVFIDPPTGQVLGYAATFIGETKQLLPGDPATFLLMKITEGVKVGDRLFVDETKKYPEYFEPKAPSVAIRGLIIGMFDDQNQVGENQLVIINQGKDKQLSQGDVLAVYKPGKLITDPVLFKQEMVKLPKERVGEIMLFRIFDQVSFGIVVRASEPMEKLYFVTNP